MNDENCSDDIKFPEKKEKFECWDLSNINDLKPDPATQYRASFALVMTIQASFTILTKFSSSKTKSHSSILLAMMYETSALLRTKNLEKLTSRSIHSS